MSESAPVRICFYGRIQDDICEKSVKNAANTCMQKNHCEKKIKKKKNNREICAKTHEK